MTYSAGAEAQPRGGEGGGGGGGGVGGGQVVGGGGGGEGGAWGRGLATRGRGVTSRPDTPRPAAHTARARQHTTPPDRPPCPCTFAGRLAPPWLRFLRLVAEAHGYVF